MKRVMTCVIALLPLLATPAVWAKDPNCTQENIGGVTFWSCDDLNNRSLAERAIGGDKTAQYEFGMAHVEGKGVPKDFNEAVKWLSRAADQGVPAAHYQMGMRYAAGEGVEKDIEQAIAAWTMAAMSGYGDAQLRLAESYDQGVGVEQDLLQAYVWYKMSVSSSFVPLQSAIDRRDALEQQLSASELESAETMYSSLYQQILMNKLMRK